MATEEIIEWFRPIYSEIWNPINEQAAVLELKNNFLRAGELRREESVDEILGNAFSKFYSFFQSWEVKWKTKEQMGFKAEGSFDFYSLDRVLYNWDDKFGGNSFAPDMKGFRPMDMFYESAGCVGFYQQTR